MAEAELFRDKYRVASTRLPGYDYRQSGIYFVTICTASRVPHFGTIAVPDDAWDNAVVLPTPLGRRVLAGWHSMPHFTPFVTPDAFVLMPDHIHGLLVFDKAESIAQPVAYKNRFGPQRDNLAAVIRGFKAGVSQPEPLAK